MNKNINIIYDLDGSKIVLINDIKFRGKRDEWKLIEECLKEYVGEFYEIGLLCLFIMIEPGILKDIIYIKRLCLLDIPKMVKSIYMILYP